MAFVPVGLDRLAGTLVPALRAGRSVVVPVALGLLALSLVPITLAGLELVTTRAAPSEVIDRDVGSATMLEVVGNAYDTGLPAGTDADGRPRRWLALRDGPDRRSMLLVRTPSSLEALRTREITARVETDASLVTRVTDALAVRGAPGPGTPLSAEALDGRYLVESTGAADARRLDDPSEIRALPAGSVVRLELRLTGEGIATCTLDAACDAAQIGAGEGPWLQRAAGVHSTQAVIVETAYPSTVIPVDLVGEQVRDPDAVVTLLDTPAAGVLIGWGRSLEVALLEHDPELPIDRSLPAMLALVGLGIFLLLARRLAYPVFRHEAASSGWTRGASASISGRATGRLAVGDGPPMEAVDMPVSFVPGAPPRVVAEAPGGRLTLDVPAASAAVSGLQRGRLAWLRGSRPAAWLNWYRTDLRVAFDTEADRDAAAALLSAVTAPPAPPPVAPPSPPPPPRRVTRTDPEDEAPTWRRPRPRGVR